MNTTITFRTDEDLKNEAVVLFESLGMNLSTALNMFMRQAVLKQKYPCALDLEIQNPRDTYPSDFFELFGSGSDIDIVEPSDEVIQIGEIEV